MPTVRRQRPGPAPLLRPHDGHGAAAHLARLGAGPRVERALGLQGLDADGARPQELGPGHRRTTSSASSQSDDDNERDSGGPRRDEHLRPRARVERRAHGPASPVQRLRAVLPALAVRRHEQLPLPVRAGPIDATFGSDANGDRISVDRPYSAPGVSFQRNAFRNEPLKDVSLRLQWKYKLAGEHTAIFSFEAFNLFNWDNIELSGTTVTNYCSAPVPLDCGFSTPTNPNFLSLTDQVPTSARFGKLLLNNVPGSPRQIQLGARFRF